MSHAGLVTIETANATLDEPFSTPGARSGTSRGARRARAGADQFVMIAVSDTGSGMPPEVAARACEPFFTTKGPGEGTGLGLSQVAGFARQSGGCVRISSAPGRGTTVRLYLPKSNSGSVPPAAGEGGGPITEGLPGREAGKTHWRAWSMKGVAAPAARAGAGLVPRGSERPRLAVGAGPER
ncbi:MAG TPA: ATP-binding protein, partial [Trebonia sp.]|nr:ATP-binding protein [Trebonia sp.]